MASYLIIFLLFLLQFIYFPIGTSHFETPKVYIAEISMFILVILYILFPRPLALSRRKVIPLAGIFVISIIDLLFLHTDTTFFGNAFRLQGVFLLWMLLILSLLSAPIKLPKLSPYFIFGILILQLLASLFVAGGINERAVGTLGEPNTLAATVIFIWPFLFSPGNNTKKKKLLLVFALLIVGVIIFLSGSRSGMIGFVLQVVFLILQYFNPQSINKHLIICLILLACTYILPFGDKSSPYEQRSEVWQGAIVAGLDKPILGHGFGNIADALRQTNKKLHNNLQNSYVDSAHNIFLDWWVQGGVLGLGIFLFLLFHTFQNFLKEKNSRNLVLLVGLLAALSFNPASSVSLVALWWLVGQGLACLGG